MTNKTTNWVSLSLSVFLLHWLCVLAKGAPRSLFWQTRLSTREREMRCCVLLSCLISLFSSLPYFLLPYIAIFVPRDGNGEREMKDRKKTVSSFFMPIAMGGERERVVMEDVTEWAHNGKGVVEIIILSLSLSPQTPSLVCFFPSFLSWPSEEEEERGRESYEQGERFPSVSQIGRFDNHMLP